jgi:hypothetical protein
MKKGTQALMKYKKLKRRLDLPLWQVNGLLESLWQITAESAPRGDIGKFSNEDIAAAMEYGGDEEKLIFELTDCEWLDPSDRYRLVVHDWPDHCPNYIKGNIEHKGGFATADPKDRPKGHPKDTPKGQDTSDIDTLRDTPGATPDPTPPSLVLPNPVQPSQEQPNTCSNPTDSERGRFEYPEDFDKWWEAYPKKVGKKAAFKRWKEAIKTLGGGDQAKWHLLEAAQAYSESPLVKSGSGVHDPQGWLNQGKYDDDRTAWVPVGHTQAAVEIDPYK